MKSAPEIEHFILRRLSDVVGPNYARPLSPQVSVFDYGIDSLAAVTLIAQVSDWLERYVPAEIIFDLPTPCALALHLADDTRKAADAKGRA